MEQILFSPQQKNDNKQPCSVNSFYKIGRKIGSGTFGELRLGKHISTKCLVAIKIEPKSAKVPQLLTEYQNYMLLGENLGFPKVFMYTESSDCRLLVMELLGCNLEELFNLCGRHFTTKTVCKLALQTLDRLKSVHSKGLVYRDIKPENFVMGKYQSSHQHIVHLVDFGLAKLYIDSEGQHIPFAQNRNLTGTARYMSLNAHFGVEQSRRDDLISLGYVLVYLMKGRLPWQGLPADDAKEKCRKIAEVKKSIGIEELCIGLPVELLKYFYYVHQLDFYDAPDYAFVRSLFSRVLAKLNVYEYDMDFEWNSILANRYLQKRKAKLQALMTSSNAVQQQPTTSGQTPTVQPPTTSNVQPPTANVQSNKNHQAPVEVEVRDEEGIGTVEEEDGIKQKQKKVTQSEQDKTNDQSEEWEDKAVLEGQYLILPLHELLPPNQDQSKRNFSTENVHGATN